jgi:hypothetical protein
MYCYRHLTKKRQKDEELMFDDVDERRKRRRRRKTKTASIEKEQKKVKKRFQNKCVSSQNHRYKKRRGRHGRRFCRPFCHRPSLSGLTRLSFVGRKAVLQRKSKPLGNTHKIPFISDYRVVASTKFLDFHFCLALQNKWNKYKKMQIESEKAD